MQNTQKMKIIKDLIEMREFSKSAMAAGRKIAFVPTMGFLHEGHRQLLKTARDYGDAVVLSMFVNPTQFGPTEDYKTYPRDIERDLKIATDDGVDAVFMPEVAAMYPAGHQSFVEVTGVTQGLCGAKRPGHFRGVTTVVMKLFNIVAPDVAIFGEKDFQQLAAVKTMVADLNMDVEIIGVPTIRESDGLAMSSRNAYLSPEERIAAAAIPVALEAAQKDFADGGRDAAFITGRVKKILEKEPLVVVEYIEVCDAMNLTQAGQAKPGDRLFVAVRVGRTRLIDNCGF